MKIDVMNTFRALKDEPLLARVACKFGFHTWTRWETGTIREFGFSKFLPHQRVCIHCNLHDMKEVKMRRAG